MKLLVFITFVSLLTLSISIDAKVCKKGQPCGNSCISWAKTCRINSVAHPKIVTNKEHQANLSINTNINDQKTLFGCELAWGAIVDTLLFEESEEEVIKKALLKIESSNEDNHTVQKAEIQNSIRNLLKEIKNDQNLISGIKTNYIDTYNQFLPACITETEKLLRKK
ncbi:hypothetical protein [Shewanella aquimarina]|uniref:hypothetical protein n=1 Tax=Shewanella aquimarina TaxID=260365 RepID=UPI00201497CA|nr:hypothetical protein [Shewanella aquimarina]MCL2910981.1 hypothetical protein [Shewanella aquimarina]